MRSLGLFRTFLIVLAELALVCAAATPSRAADPETEVGKLLGKSLSETFAAQYGVINDPLLTQWVNRMGAQLAAVSPRQNLNYHFSILDTSEINAFSLPGGYVFVTRGLLDYLQSRDELAGVMGHEVGHVAGNHAMRLLEWQFGSALAVRFAPLPHDRTSYGLETAAIFLSTLQFSRHNESQADLYGIRFATLAGYDPDGLAQFLKTFGVRKPGFFEKYLATHPPDSVRLKALQKTPYMDPQNWQIQETIGDRLAEANRPALALRHYREAAASHPDEPRLNGKIQALVTACSAQAPPALKPPVVPPPAPISPAPAPPSATSGSPAPPASPAPTSSSGRGDRDLTSPVPAQPNPQEALLAIAEARTDVAGSLRRTANALKVARPLFTVNSTLRDALLGASASRLDDVRWLALAYQAYGHVSRLGDTFARVARVQYSIESDLARMENEVRNAGTGPAALETYAEAIRMAGEVQRAARANADASSRLERSMPLAAAILGDLDSVLLGIGGRVGNLQFGAVEAAVLALGEQVKEGRHLSGEALETLTVGEVRLLVVEMNQLTSQIPPNRSAVVDANVMDILGGKPDAVASLRQQGLSYGDAALSLCESEEIGWTTTLVEAQYSQMIAASRAANAFPPGRVDAALAAGGSSAPIEIMLNQAARALREEMSCG